MARPTKARPETVNFSAKLTPRAKIYLESLARMVGKTEYAVLEEAFWSYFETFSDEKKQVITAFANATLAEHSKTTNPKS